jgi:hypothetical protein
MESTFAFRTLCEINSPHSPMVTALKKISLALRLSIMNVLGIHIGHDSSAALIRDGKILADVAEERFTRVKHYCGLPIHSLEYCLKSQGLTMSDVDAVAVPSLAIVPDRIAARRFQPWCTPTHVAAANGEK